MLMIKTACCTTSKMSMLQSVLLHKSLWHTSQSIVEFFSNLHKECKRKIGETKTGVEATQAESH